MLEKVRWKAYFYSPAVWNPADSEGDLGYGWRGGKKMSWESMVEKKINQWTKTKVIEEFTKQLMWAKIPMHYVEPRLKEAGRIFHK